MATREYEFTVDELSRGVRLDTLLTQLPETDIPSRSFGAKLIQQGKVLINGKIAKPASKPVSGDIISLSLDEPKEIDVLPEDIPLDIVYEDSDIAVVNKPIGMVVHPAPGNESGTLVNALLYHIKDLSGIGGVKRPGIVHRIDKMTSGLIVIAKTDRAHISLSEQIKEHSAGRTYIALVNGNIKEDTLTVDKPIGRNPEDRKKMAVYREGESGIWRDAVTNVAVLERFLAVTLIEAKLQTGRTHQIRVHMTYIKHPLIGDDLYSSGKNNLGFSGQALHAINLELTHPVTGERMKFFAPLPEVFEKALKKLNSEYDFSGYMKDTVNDK